MNPQLTSRLIAALLCAVIYTAGKVAGRAEAITVIRDAARQGLTTA